MSTKPKYGVPQATVTLLQAQQAVWIPALQAHKDLEAQAGEASKAKTLARDALEVPLRLGIRSVNATPGITNADRVALKLPAHDLVATPVGAPTTFPIGHIKQVGALRQEIHWTDQTTPHSRAKPAGVHHCELSLKTGDPAPVDETGCILAARDSATPYLYEFAPADVGKTAYWLLRWVNGKGEHGPWGALVSGKING